MILSGEQVAAAYQLQIDLAAQVFGLQAGLVDLQRLLVERDARIAELGVRLAEREGGEAG